MNRPELITRPFSPVSPELPDDRLDHSQRASARERLVPSCRPGRRTAQRILEAGPGTGAVTSCIIERMRHDDQLWMVELNPTFAAHLRSAFKEKPSYRSVADRCHLVEGSVQQLDPMGALRRFWQFDLIISGLPLNNFSSARRARHPPGVFEAAEARWNSLVLSVHSSPARQNVRQRRARAQSAERCWRGHRRRSSAKRNSPANGSGRTSRPRGCTTFGSDAEREEGRGKRE